MIYFSNQFEISAYLSWGNRASAAQPWRHTRRRPDQKMAACAISGSATSSASNKYAVGIGVCINRFSGGSPAK
jgi:hypothetical protein